MRQTAQGKDVARIKRVLEYSANLDALIRQQRAICRRIAREALRDEGTPERQEAWKSYLNLFLDGKANLWAEPPRSLRAITALIGPPEEAGTNYWGQYLAMEEDEQ